MGSLQTKPEGVLMGRAEWLLARSPPEGVRKSLLTGFRSGVPPPAGAALSC
jgi:hypothetical protein